MLEYLVNIFLVGVEFNGEYIGKLRKKYPYPGGDRFTWDEISETALILRGKDEDTPPLQRPSISEAVRFTYYNGDQRDLCEGLVLPLVSGDYYVFMSKRSGHYGPTTSDLIFHIAPWLMNDEKCECCNERRYTYNYYNDQVQLVESDSGVTYRHNCPRCSGRKTWVNVSEEEVPAMIQELTDLKAECERYHGGWVKVDFAPFASAYLAASKERRVILRRELMPLGV